MSRLFRYTFIVVLVALSTALAAVGGWRYARASAPVSGPIIVISVDTLRADHLPIYGYKNVRTPAIDALAADSVVFERAYSHAPQTLPAHASMLSGRLPFETGVRDDIGFTVKPGERLLPQMLRDRGFTTGGIVSAYVLRQDTGIAQGFDFFDGEMPPSAPDATNGQLQRDGAASEAIAERWLGSQQSSRLFLFLHLFEPHKPYAPPERFSELAPYDGEIAYADEIIGRLMRYLKSHQLYDRSTIVLVSDHGEGLGDHGEQEHGLLVYDEAIHVPLVIKQAGNTGAGRRVADLVQHVDLVPTMLDLVNAPIPGSLRGRSLKTLLDGTGRPAESAVYSEALYARYHFGWSELIALTDGRYRYIKAPRKELYDLDLDPDEGDNIARARATATETLGAALDRLIGTTIHRPGNISAQTLERLGVLGYVGAQTDVTTVPGDALPDPKDKRHILETYRTAVELAGDHKWGQAIMLLRQILQEDPGMINVWDQLATFSMRAERYDQAVEAYKRIIALKPAQTAAYLGAAAAMLKLKRLDEAHAHAGLAAGLAVEGDFQGRASAHELLARIALARHDIEDARAEARRAREADSRLPLPTYIEARLLYDQGKYAEALPLFQAAIAELNRTDVPRISELHFYAADTLSRLERSAEAEQQFVEELRSFPQNARARAGLATLYHASGRPEAAAAALEEMVRAIPTPDTYALAARLWTMFGNKQQADEVRAAARRAFPASRADRAVQH